MWLMRYPEGTEGGSERLGGGRPLEVGDEVVTVLVLLQASKRHLGTGDVL